jgi:hypothetical protein
MNETPRPSFSLRDILAQIRRRLPWWPTKPPAPVADRFRTARVQAQLDVIKRAFDREFGEGSVAAAGGKDGGDGEFDYLYHPRRMLVRDGEDFELLRRFFDDPERERDFEGELRRMSEPVAGRLVVTEVPLRRDGRDPVLATLEELDRAYPERAERREPIAMPDHILYVTVVGRLCPFTEPEEPPVSDPVPGPATDTSAGDGVRVSVVDTGLWVKATTKSETDWLAGVTPADADDEEIVDATAIHEYAGHGTFVAGIVKCVAPGTKVQVEGALPLGGAVYESRLCEELHEALAREWDPQLVSISAGTYTRENLGLLGFEIFAETHGLTDGTKGLVVAAAGNDSTDDPFYPAAFPWVIGVGALDEQGNVASYSNYGDWVDVWARGSNLVNAFPEGVYTCHEPPNTGQVRSFKHLAQWSGTSFATPVVTGEIAAQMSATRNPDDPKKAYDQVEKAAPKCPDPKARGRKHLGSL